MSELPHIKALYRANFFFSVKGIEYSINYFKSDQKDLFFTETIYKLPDGQPISKKLIDYKVPSAGIAFESLQELLNRFPI